MAAQNNNFFLSDSFNNRSSTEKLFSSIGKRRNAVTILTLIQEGADINARDSKGYTPLLLASKYGLKTVVNLLTDSGAKVDNSESRSKRTLLHYASRHGWTEMVKSLVKRVHVPRSMVHGDCSDPCGESNFSTIHAKDVEGRTALHIASFCGHLGVVKCLFDKGADIHTKNKLGGTALHEATGGGHLEVVKFLLEKGANLAAREEGGETALHKASGGGHLKVVKYLLDKGANMEVKSCEGATPLLVAAKCLSLDVVVLLINLGANVDSCDGDQCTVLHYASEVGCIEMVRYLVKRVAVPPFTLDQDTIVSCKDSFCPTFHARDMDGGTALHRTSFSGHIDVVNFLVEEGAELDVRNKNGETVLHEASYYGHLAVVKFLVDSGADINVRNCKGVTPLLLAARFFHKGIVELLVNSGANLEGCDEYKNTVLHYASQEGWTQIVQSLVGRLSNIDARNNNGETALFPACRSGRLQSVEYLLKAGASLNIRNKKGNLPINLHNVFRPSIEFLKLFIKSGAYLTPVDYYKIVNNFSINTHILGDVKFCCQAIINKFNSHDLPALCKLPACASLPRIEKMMIASSSGVAKIIEQTVELEIQTNGHCNVVEVRPMALSLFSVRSVLEYFNTGESEIQKRFATSDNDYQRLSKLIRLS